MPTFLHIVVRRCKQVYCSHSSFSSPFASRPRANEPHDSEQSLVSLHRSPHRDRALVSLSPARTWLASHLLPYHPQLRAASTRRRFPTIGAGRSTAGDRLDPDAVFPADFVAGVLVAGVLVVGVFDLDFFAGGALGSSFSSPFSSSRASGQGAEREGSAAPPRFGELSRELPAQHVLGQVCPRAGQPALEKLGETHVPPATAAAAAAARPDTDGFPSDPAIDPGSTTATSGLGLDGTTSPLAEILRDARAAGLEHRSEHIALDPVGGGERRHRHREAPPPPPSKGLAPAANQRAAASGDTRPMSAPRQPPFQRCSTNDSGPRNFPRGARRRGTTCRAAARPRRRRREI